jgi:NTP pyrophosphatase (non-canonical NTP hydrolase)
MEKIKTIADYQQLAKRTCVNLESYDKNQNHMWLGIVTEVGEILDVCKKNLAYSKPVDVVNIGEEIADVVWYIANKANLEGLILLDDITEVDETLWLNLCSAYDNFIKIAERTTDVKVNFTIQFYKDFFGNFDMLNTFDLLTVTKFLSDFWQFDFYQLLSNNINKLQVRYPEKFTNEAALNRNLEAERVELEK